MLVSESAGIHLRKFFISEHVHASKHVSMGGSIGTVQYLHAKMEDIFDSLVYPPHAVGQGTPGEVILPLLPCTTGTEQIRQFALYLSRENLKKSPSAT
jgi:hypothetical protein